MTELRYGAGIEYTKPDGYWGGETRWFDTAAERDAWVSERGTKPDVNSIKVLDRDDFGPFAVAARKAERDAMTETPLELLREIRDGLAPSLTGLSEDDPVAALRWVDRELQEYLLRVQVFTLWGGNDDRPHDPDA